MDEVVHMKYIRIENGEVILYVQLFKVLCGCLKIALLFYKRLVSDLESVGFELNPYDPCAANKKINR